jgi:hypothetical protein
MILKLYLMTLEKSIWQIGKNTIQIRSKEIKHMINSVIKGTQRSIIIAINGKNTRNSSIK